ncbi:MAG: non-hydrolyzing UDP-N-acetylglucosamine 2-epimerase [Planctomycetaceae bacterium]
MKLATIVGARPQFIKAAVLSRLLRERADLDERLVHTGQHYDTAMSDVFFEELDLPRPHYALHVGSGSHAAQTGAMLVEIEKVLVAERPDAVVVYGDTNSTIAGALAAAKLVIPVAHVEAGLRSYDRSMPEEINRCVTDHLSHWHFCPTRTAVDNLNREGIAERIYQVGDVMYDALIYYGRSETPSAALGRLKLAERPYALCTLHRAGNTDDVGRFARIWEAINRLSAELPIVLPLHPRTRKVVHERGLRTTETLHVVDPVGYREMLTLEKRAKLIVTDSGGVQKEAYMQGVPCLTLRDNTEWTETLDAGWNRLIGSDADRLLAAARDCLRYGPPRERPPLYGDGRSGERILAALTGAVAADEFLLAG